MARLGVVLSILCAVLAASASAQARLPTVLAGYTGKDFQVRPGSISYTGDGTGILGGADGTGARHPGHLRWTRYDQQAGQATGRVWINDCRPSCAEGHFQARPVTVTVGHPSGGHFHQMVLTYSLDGRRYVDRRVLQRTGTAWVWGIAR